MRICYVGNFRPSHSTETHIAATLESMGHTVDRVQEDELRIFHKYSGCDLFLWTRTWPGYVSRDVLTRLAKLKIPTVSLHLDLYIGISREQDMAADPFWQTDYVFTPDGDPTSAVIFKKMGINHHWLPAGVFKPECQRGVVRPEMVADVAFIGSTYGYHPEWPYREKLVNFLRSAYPGRLKLYGGAGRRPVRGQDLNDALASIKVIVGDSLCVGFKHERYWSDRVYETTGRGGFIIHPYIRGLETQFKVPAELVCYRFGDFEYLKGLIDFYLRYGDIREKLRDRGMRRTRRDHTYNSRMAEMLEMVNAP